MLIGRRLEPALSPPFCFGQVSVHKATAGGFVLSNRDDEDRQDLQIFRHSEDAIEIAKYDDAGEYRSLKTAPNLRHGWRLELATVEQLERALDYFYPGRLAVFAAWKSGQLKTTPLRETPDRQSGMYRVASKISDPQVDDLVADFCRSDGAGSGARMGSPIEIATKASEHRQCQPGEFVRLQGCLDAAAASAEERGRPKITLPERFQRFW